MISTTRHVLGVLDILDKKAQAAPSVGDRQALRRSVATACLHQGMEVSEHQLTEALNEYEHGTIAQALVPPRPAARTPTSEETGRDGLSVFEIGLTLGIMLVSMLALAIMYGRVSRSLATQHTMEEVALVLHGPADAPNSSSAEDILDLHEWLASTGAESATVVLRQREADSSRELDIGRASSAVCSAFASEPAFDVSLSDGTPVTPAVCAHPGGTSLRVRLAE